MILTKRLTLKTPFVKSKVQAMQLRKRIGFDAWLGIFSQTETASHWSDQLKMSVCFRNLLTCRKTWSVKSSPSRSIYFAPEPSKKCAQKQSKAGLSMDRCSFNWPSRTYRPWTKVLYQLLTWLGITYKLPNYSGPTMSPCRFLMRASNASLVSCPWAKRKWRT